MKNLLLLITFAFTSLSHIEAQEKYDVKRIPEGLTKEANVIKRMEEISFEIKKLDETVLKHKYALTILNEKGEKHAMLVMFYDKLNVIKSIEGSLYDANGKLIRKLKSKEIVDVSGVDDNNLIDDNRRKLFSFYHKIYPYTVEFETEEEIKNTLFFPGWVPQQDELYAVEQSKMSVICPENYEFRYKSFNYKDNPVTSIEKGKKVTTWQIKNLPAFKQEFGLPHRFEITTAVLLGPSEFKIQNYTGNMNNWKEFGKFVFALKENKDQLPDAIKQKVHELTDHLKSDKEKIKTLYEFMQQHTRYVSIQLGIGGWQPFDAKFVASKGYGDCKALTNYMYSLLKEAGIKSYYTLIKAGKNASDIISDFTSQQFNHVILSVPSGSDTTWLECTSQTMPSGYIGDFTSDRYALMIDESGGTLVRTPKYGMKENLQIRKIEATVQPDGLVKVNTHAVYTGIQQDNLHSMINNISKDKIKEHLNQELDFSTYDVSQFQYKEKKDILPSIQEDLELQVTNYATITGKRLFILPNIMSRSYQKLSKETERKYPLSIKYEYQDIDTVTFHLPAGYEAESVPQSINIDTKFGKFSSKVILEGNKLVYFRDFQQYSGVYAAAEYKDLANFYESIYKADRARVVLVKKSE